MKKYLYIAKMVVLFVVFSALAVFGGDLQWGDLQKGQMLLDAKTKELTAMKNNIKMFVKESAKDGKISGKEMRQLQKLVQEFYKMKDEANKKLAWYNLYVGVEVDPLIKMAVDKYFGESEFDIIHKDPDGTVKYSLIKIAGMDLNEEVKIESYLDVNGFIFLIIVVGPSLLLLWVMIYLSLSHSTSKIRL